MNQPRKPLVQNSAEHLRDILFSVPAGTRVGTLPDLARKLGVGIVTVQQAARILEHEGLLEVKRGPGGGYYGTRPDDATLERAITAYMRVHPASFDEAADITSLLFNELVPAAAACRDERLREALRVLGETIEFQNSEAERGNFETAFQDLLFEMVDRPLFEALTRVTLRFAQTRGASIIDSSRAGIAEWRSGRERIIAAILASDTELARFEADRSNRRAVKFGLGKA